MKEAELSKHTTCNLCNRLVTAGGLPLFWCLTVERHGMNAQALKRQMGLSNFMGGNTHLARIMGPDEDVTMPIMEPIKLTVCEGCMMDHASMVMHVAMEADAKRAAGGAPS